MTEKQKQTIVKLKEEIVRLKKKNSELRQKKGLPKLKGMPRAEVPTKKMLMNCGECGQRVFSDQPHSLDDCKKYTQSKANQNNVVTTK